MGVEGSVEYNGAVSALRFFPARKRLKVVVATSPTGSVYEVAVDSDDAGRFWGG